MSRSVAASPRERPAPAEWRSLARLVATHAFKWAPAPMQRSTPGPLLWRHWVQSVIIGVPKTAADGAVRTAEHRILARAGRVSG